MNTTTTEPIQQTTVTTAWMELARASAIAMVVWAILLHLMAQTVIPPVIVVGLVFLGFAPALSGERRRVGLAYAIVAMVALVGNAPVILDELIHIDSAPSFVLTLLSVVGAFVAIVAGLGVFLQWPTATIRPIAAGAVVVFGIGALASVVTFTMTDSAVAAGGDVKVVAEKIAYTPGDITLESDEDGIWIENKDGIHHTFTVKDLGVDLEIPALRAARVDIDAPPGVYSYICTVPGHENMTGTLTING